jgi:16S rRNA (cytosine967-C5)-methyltransferase
MVSARAAALHALLALEKGRHDRLRDVLERRGPRGRDLAFASELAHGVVRQQRLLDHVLGGLAHRGLPKDLALRCALRLGAYQLLFLGGVPAHAAVDETVRLVRTNRGFANALLRRLADRIEERPAAAGVGPDELRVRATRVLQLPAPLPEGEVERLATLYSLPPFLVERWLPRLGAAAVEQIGTAAVAVPPVFLRVTPGCDPGALGASLAAQGVAVEPHGDGRLLRWTGGESPFTSEAFGLGQFAVQDPTALAAADAVPCGPGDTVIDLCAAPGTKTSWLAAKVRPGGTVFAFDPDETRRYLVVENVARLRLGDTVRIVERREELPLAKAVLADVPCSNCGVLGRRVEVRRRLASGTFARMAVLQRELLRQALAHVAPGGHAVYSTCSIDREENEAVVEAVLAAADVPPCELVRSATTLPLAGVHDGGFLALIRRG